MSNTFTSNHADYGGAIYFADYSDYNQVLHCIFDGNSAVQSGGAMYLEFEQAIVSCLFFNNESENGSGGAVYFLGNSDFLNCTVIENSAPSGAGLAFDQSNAEIANCATADANSVVSLAAR